VKKTKRVKKNRRERGERVGDGGWRIDDR